MQEAGNAAPRRVAIKMTLKLLADEAFDEAAHEGLAEIPTVPERSLGVHCSGPLSCTKLHRLETELLLRGRHGHRTEVVVAYNRYGNFNTRQVLCHAPAAKCVLESLNEPADA